ADAGQAEPVEFAEELPRARDAFLEGWQRQLIEQGRDGGVVAVDPAGRLAGSVPFDLAARRHVGVVRNIERLEARGTQQRSRIKQLNIYGVVRRRGHKLGLSRPALLGELLLGPTTGHDNPLVWTCCTRRRRDTLHRLRDRTGTDPVDLSRVEQGRPNGVHVGIDQARDNGAAAEIDNPGGRPRGVGVFGGWADRRDVAVAYRQRFSRRRVLVEYDDLAVDERRFGGLRGDPRSECGRQGQDGGKIRARNRETGRSILH